MKKLFVPAIVLSLTVCGMLVAEELKSGLQPGSFPGPFVVTDITGPAKGESLCYRADGKALLMTSESSPAPLYELPLK